MLNLRCPKCMHTMLYQPMDPILSGKVKRCVFCGRSFKVTRHIVKGGIVSTRS